MNAEIKVTKRHIVIDSGSIKKATLTCSDPTGSHVKSVCVNSRLDGARPSTATQTITANTNDIATVDVARIPAIRSPRRRPANAKIKKPIRGNSGIKKAVWIMSTQPFMLEISSALAVALRRKIVTTMPNPTTTSAAATTKMKKTSAWPPTSFNVLENVTKLKFAALSINSMHMNITNTFLLTRTPKIPMPKRIAESMRYHDEGILTDPPPRVVLARLKVVHPHHRYSSPPNVERGRLPRRLQ